MIIIREIDHDKQRYPTAGDWYFTPNKDIIINVSKTADWRVSALVAVHELVEALGCLVDGVSEEDVTNHDLWFEDQQLEGEPGDHPTAPYYKQHQLATKVEKLVCEAFGMKWDEYDQAVEQLFEEAANGK